MVRCNHNDRAFFSVSIKSCLARDWTSIFRPFVALNAFAALRTFFIYVSFFYSIELVEPTFRELVLIYRTASDVAQAKEVRSGEASYSASYAHAFL